MNQMMSASLIKQMIIDDELEWHLVVLNLPAPNQVDFTMAASAPALSSAIEDHFLSLLTDTNLCRAIARLKFDDGTPGISGSLVIVPEGGSVGAVDQ